jgi:hypothetical protein
MTKFLLLLTGDELINLIGIYNFLYIYILHISIIIYILFKLEQRGHGVSEG